MKEKRGIAYNLKTPDGFSTWNLFRGEVSPLRVKRVPFLFRMMMELRGWIRGQKVRVMPGITAGNQLPRLILLVSICFLEPSMVEIAGMLLILFWGLE